MVLIEENNISSGIDGFACEEPWERLKSESCSLQSFQRLK